MFSLFSKKKGPVSAYDFSFSSLVDRDDLPLSRFRGQVMLICNTASRCSFTSQYALLEKIYETYKHRGFVVIGVPSNDFGNQETGAPDEIYNLCFSYYGVRFPMASRQTVSGSSAHPFYRWARQELGFFASPKWNFHKYLIDRKGYVIDYFHSMVSPDSLKVIAAIEKCLDSEL